MQDSSTPKLFYLILKRKSGASLDVVFGVVQLSSSPLDQKKVKKTAICKILLFIPLFSSINHIEGNGQARN
jgi:hypothetical protein